MSNVYEFADTWNAGGTTFTGIGLNVTDTASASGSKLLNLMISSVSKGNLRKDGRFSALAFALGDTDADSPDVFLARDAANVLALRNSTTAQAMRVYNTYTDGSNYERGHFAWNSNILDIGAVAAGSGTLRKTRLLGAQVLLDADGTAALPALAFDIGGNYAYGMWYSAGEIRFSVNGTEAASITTGAIKVGSLVGNAASPGRQYGYLRIRYDVTSSATLTSPGYNGSTVTNAGAGSGITSTLVSAVQGWNIRFLDDNATNRYTIKPNTGDTILWPDGTVVTAATGSIVATARYDAFDVEALDATTWLASNVRGTWTVTA